MSVTITWTDSAGTSLSDPVDMGASGVNQTTSGNNIYIRHDGTNQIKNAKIYIAPVTSSYAGDFAAQTDFDELLAWGDAVTSGTYGGLQLNMDPDSGSWPDYEVTLVSGNKDLGSSYTVRTGFGDSAANGLILSSNMSTEMGTPGIVPASMTNWPKLAARVRIPTGEGSTGVRHVSQKLRYTYTS